MNSTANNSEETEDASNANLITGWKLSKMSVSLTHLSVREPIKTQGYAQSVPQISHWLDLNVSELQSSEA